LLHSPTPLHSLSCCQLGFHSQEPCHNTTQQNDQIAIRREEGGLNRAALQWAHAVQWRRLRLPRADLGGKGARGHVLQCTRGGHMGPATSLACSQGKTVSRPPLSLRLWNSPPSHGFGSREETSRSSSRTG
jgi:hypothetical protein